MPPYIFLRPAQLSPPAANCSIIFNAGLLVLRPMSIETFNALIVAPVSSKSVPGYVHTEQGMLNTLFYDGSRGLGWKEAYAVLHPRFNTVARSLGHAERRWGVTKAVGVHWTGLSSRPWMKNYSATSEWHSGCGVAP